MMLRPSRFLVLGHFRSGSTLLQDLLGKHPHICMHGELLNWSNFNNWDSSFGDGEATARVHAAPGEARIKVIAAELDALAAKKPGCKMVGFKLMPEQLVEAGMRIDTLVAELEVRHVVVVYRANFLETLYSLLRAQKTQVWMQRQEEQNCSGCRDERTGAMHIPQASLDEYCRKQRQLWSECAEIFPPSLRPMYVEFQQLQLDRTATVHSVVRGLCLEPSEELDSTLMVRQNPGRLEQKVSNLDELRCPALFDPPAMFDAVFRRRLGCALMMSPGEKSELTDVTSCGRERRVTFSEGIFRSSVCNQGYSAPRQLCIPSQTRFYPTELLR